MFENESVGLPENKYCPVGYSLANGARYFMMDKNHPDRFFFFSIGQYGIMLDPNDMQNSKLWQETVVVY
uniref:Uncharacterized protein n=1 Tax=candidate division CPR3 bacterium TaxID=2268181 RepID=A0A7C4R5K1_UNCC3